MEIIAHSQSPVLCKIENQFKRSSLRRSTFCDTTTALTLKCVDSPNYAAIKVALSSTPSTLNSFILVTHSRHSETTLWAKNAEIELHAGHNKT